MLTRIGQRLGTQRLQLPEPGERGDRLPHRPGAAPLRWHPWGEVSLDVAWSLIDDRSGDVVIRQASYRQMSEGTDFDAYAATLSAVLAQLGDDLAAAAKRPPVVAPYAERKTRRNATGKLNSQEE